MDVVVVSVRPPPPAHSLSPPPDPPEDFNYGRRGVCPSPFWNGLRCPKGPPSPPKTTRIALSRLGFLVPAIMEKVVYGIPRWRPPDWHRAPTPAPTSRAPIPVRCRTKTKKEQTKTTTKHNLIYLIFFGRFRRVCFGGFSLSWSSSGLPREIPFVKFIFVGVLTCSCMIVFGGGVRGDQGCQFRSGSPANSLLHGSRPATCARRLATWGRYIVQSGAEIVDMALAEMSQRSLSAII